MSRVILGIDPGLGGALAFLELGRGLRAVHDIPTLVGANGKTVLDMAGLFDLIAGDSDVIHVALEQVGARPGQGVSSVFRFGQVFGAIEMAVAAAQLPLMRVTPSKWKGRLGLSSDKGAARSRAVEIFPSHAESFRRVKDADRAEAALIASYAAGELSARGLL